LDFHCARRKVVCCVSPFLVDFPNRLPKPAFKSPKKLADALGRRVVRKWQFVMNDPANPAAGDNWFDRGETRFVNDGMQVAQERDAQNVTQTQLTWGMGQEGGAGGLLLRTVKNGKG
jgi:hypothetical protein